MLWGKMAESSETSNFYWFIALIKSCTCALEKKNHKAAVATKLAATCIITIDMCGDMPVSIII